MQENNLPDEIWAESIDKMHYFESEEEGEGCACGGFLTKYIRSDLVEVDIALLKKIAAIGIQHKETDKPFLQISDAGIKTRPEQIVYATIDYLVEQGHLKAKNK